MKPVLAVTSVSQASAPADSEDPDTVFARRLQEQLDSEEEDWDLPDLGELPAVRRGGEHREVLVEERLEEPVVAAVEELQLPGDFTRVRDAGGARVALHDEETAGSERRGRGRERGGKTSRRGRGAALVRSPGGEEREEGGQEDLMARQGGQEDLMARQGGQEDLMAREGGQEDIMARLFAKDPVFNRSAGRGRKKQAGEKLTPRGRGAPAGGGRGRAGGTPGYGGRGTTPGASRSRSTPGGSGHKEYVPRTRSGAWAVLLTLAKVIFGML